ncbi:myb/SANT-like DNA-binding domain-containing protein 3 [Haematobia irritans]|uniref:myb/SANT-like DNA-binding domain-containing protein 3 n=1 Tax=Haematobia irritans TaxID=7368 RepID=UPI003F4F46C4
MEESVQKTESRSKRPRSENWSEDDKELLKELVKMRVNAIENKNTDTNTNQAKKKAWLELEKDFNNMTSCGHRTVPQLKSQWTTIKIQAKKEMSEYRSQIRKTGGGQAPLGAPLQGNDIAIWLPNEFVVDENEFDSDITFSKNDDTLDENTFLEVEMLSDIEEEVKEEIKLNSDTLKTVKSLKKKRNLPRRNRVWQKTI